MKKLRVAFLGAAQSLADIIDEVVETKDKLKRKELLAMFSKEVKAMSTALQQIIRELV